MFHPGQRGSSNIAALFLRTSASPANFVRGAPGTQLLAQWHEHLELRRGAVEERSDVTTVPHNVHQSCIPVKLLTRFLGVLFSIFAVEAESKQL